MSEDYPFSIVDEAIEMRKAALTWPRIAQILNRDERKLKQAVLNRLFNERNRAVHE